MTAASLDGATFVLIPKDIDPNALPEEKSTLEMKRIIKTDDVVFVLAMVVVICNRNEISEPGS